MLGTGVWTSRITEYEWPALNEAETKKTGIDANSLGQVKVIIQSDRIVGLTHAHIRLEEVSFEFH